MSSQRDFGGVEWGHVAYLLVSLYKAPTDGQDDELWEQAGAAYRLLIDSDDDRFARDAFLNHGIGQLVHDDNVGARATFHQAIDRAAREMRLPDAVTFAEVMAFAGDLLGAQQLFERALDHASELDDATEVRTLLRRLSAAGGDREALIRITDEEERADLTARRTDGRTDFVYYCGIKPDAENLSVEGPFLPEEATVEHHDEQASSMRSSGWPQVLRIEAETMRLAMDLAEEKRDAAA